MVSNHGRRVKKAVKSISSDLRPLDIIPDKGRNVHEALYAPVRILIERDNDISFLAACSPCSESPSHIKIPS